MKKIGLLVLICFVALFSSACTKQVVFLDRDLNTTKNDFDKYMKTIGFTYKLKDDKNHIYNILLTNYNMQYLLQSKPMVSYDLGFTCTFKDLGKDTLMSCKTYPSNAAPLSDVKKHLKEQKQNEVKYISYKKYKKLKKKNEL